MEQANGEVKMNTARLRLLREVAETLPMQHLNMDTWGGCCTTACLAGWAARYKLFNDEGLHMWQEFNKSTIAYKQYYGFTALDKFFDLHGLETTHLFSPIAYSSRKPSRDELLSHIDDILAGNFEEKFGFIPKYLEFKANRNCNTLEGALESAPETIERAA